MCIHGAAYYLCIVWFEIRFQIDLNLHSKDVWKLVWKIEKNFLLPPMLLAYWPASTPMACFISLRWSSSASIPRPVLLCSARPSTSFPSRGPIQSSAAAGLASPKAQQPTARCSLPSLHSTDSWAHFLLSR